MHSEAFEERISSRLSLYSAAVGGALFSAASIAAPVPIDGGAVFSIGPLTDSSDGQQFDLDGDTTNDFSVEIGDQSGPPPERYVRLGALTGGAFVAENLACYGANMFASNLAPGDEIGPGSTFNGFVSLFRNISGEVCTNFPSGTEGFVGFRLPISGQDHYGYLRVRATEGSMEFEVLGGAYESESETSIFIPQSQHEVTPVPVGGALPIALSMLALGAAALRRRKEPVH